LNSFDLTLTAPVDATSKFFSKVICFYAPQNQIHC